MGLRSGVFGVVPLYRGVGGSVILGGMAMNVNELKSEPARDDPRMLKRQKSPRHGVDRTGLRSGGPGIARSLSWWIVSVILFLTLAANPAPVLAANSVVLASGVLQRCLGITPGQAAFVGDTAATAGFCQQLPGAALYSLAGQRYQAGDHGGAATLATKAAVAGNPLAQLRLAIMYEAGDGVPRSKNAAFQWYARAASVGEPAAQMELGGYFEAGDGVAENWDLAARLYQASASQGWKKGQFAFGRAYEFGIGVPQNRQLAVEWLLAAGAQGHSQGRYFGQWLSVPLNNIGFRTQEEHDLVIGSRLRFALLSGDPAGITFHNSAQRFVWLTGQRRGVDASEAHVMWQLRADEYNQCRSAGGGNCINPGTDPRP